MLHSTSWLCKQPKNQLNIFTNNGKNPCEDNYSRKQIVTPMAFAEVGCRHDVRLL